MSSKQIELAQQCAAFGLLALEQFLAGTLEGPISSPLWHPVRGAPARETSSAPRPPARARAPSARQPTQIDLVDPNLLGLFSDIDGAVSGRFGLLVARPTARSLVHHLIRAEGKRREWLECSALLESANVAFSAGAGALAQDAGDTVFPSVPRMCSTLAEELAPDGAEVEGGFVVEARIVCAEQPAAIQVFFLWVPATALPGAMLGA